MYPALFSTPGMKQFAEEVDAECQAQITKFGDQCHPNLTGTPISRNDARLLFAKYAANYRDINNGSFDPRDPDRRLDWTGILLEEVYEAVAEADPAKLRAELIQVAAVCAAWVHDLDRH
ncbi:hypothetical protein ACFYST_06175 [Kitasatospora sp. NPDC004614]|uniref:hypothetical protein n=1 Tax=unclassified Kitasatospora TaxID=2633591 RepID=UPI0036A582C6